MGEGRDSEIKMCEITRQNQMADRVKEVNQLVQLYTGYVFRMSGTIQIQDRHCCVSMAFIECVNSRMHMAHRCIKNN